MQIKEKTTSERNIPSPPVPARFIPPKSALLIDRFMTHFIKIGGISIVTAVFGIFIFILMQTIPLYKGPKVHPLTTLQLPAEQYQILGVDEWGELPFLIDREGKVHFVHLKKNGRIETQVPSFPEMKRFSVVRYKPESRNLIYGFTDGHFSIVGLNYASEFEGTKRTIRAELTPSEAYYQIGEPGHPLVDMDYGDSGNDKLLIAIQDVAGQLRVHALTLTQAQTMLGSGEIEVDQTFDFTSQIDGVPEKVLVNTQGSDLIVLTNDGKAHYFARSGDTILLRQSFFPFEDLTQPQIGSVNFLFGGVSLVFTALNGTNRIFSLYQKTGSDYRTFGQTKEFESLGSRASFFSRSLRNKAFLIGNDHIASVRYGTTEEVRWQAKLPFRTELGIIGGKYDRLLFLDSAQKLHIYSLEDHHPEATARALFGKIWYEGSHHPKYEWQSTGASDDFEPKLSLVPLIIGTLKGTFYAMLFAVPVALLAAVYTSQFLNPNHRAIVKPVMEIMASLPSVVLGFLAALWLAPIVETRVPSILLMVFVLPISTFLFGYAWNRVPIGLRVKIRPGYEWIAFLPILIFLGYLCWVGGSYLERILFVVSDPDTGKKVADFRLWWPAVTGLPFEQRNSLVVGFMMGFAVIPIIFTITEDALSNVPQSLTSASLALGASRWQTAMRIVIPTASAGIFSAIMIGLGRAVGETMIVVMATGNTPIMDFNIFSGMRTLSANIAVELPEAPVHGTLYRTLFLGALTLFLMTFIVNTFAEILRQHLREKYKTV